MKTIELTQGKFAIIDDCDFDRVNQFKWFAWQSHTGIWYAIHSFPRKNRKRKLIRMHRFIMDAADNIQIDHRDHDGLNNTRENLRFATRSQNAMNQRSRKNSSSKYLGVCFDKDRGKWCAQIRVDKKLIHLGSFKNEYNAARIYDSAAIKYFGEFANVNFAPC